MPSHHIAVSARQVGKYYQVCGPREKNPLFRDAIVNSFKAPLKAFDRTRRAEGFWALKGVTFDIKEGEIVGFIGRNGAGKSTLLKILCRITPPTEGTIELHGRVGSLLEVGTGFHSELTGRENIYLSGSILGMKKKEIDDNFDEILKFSEIGNFIDTPVKRYSSGMYVRLAFAVAAHLEPDILIVDEVLAVGDFAFQKKCLNKMSSVAQEGRTVLFVSHNMVTVQNLCETCYLLDNGRIIESGPTNDVVSSYLDEGSSLSSEKIWDESGSAPGDDQIRINFASIKPENVSEDRITTSTPFNLTLRYWNLLPDAYVSIKFRLTTDIQRVVVFESMPQFDPEWNKKLFPVGLFESTCKIPGNLLNRGRYRVHISFIKNYQEVIFEIEDVLKFEIEYDPSDKLQFKIVSDFSRKSLWFGKTKGILRPVFHWTTQMLQNNHENSVKMSESDLI